MKRRSFIKNVPLALSSLAGIQAMAKRNSSGAAAEVRLHHGTPTLFLNGEPVFAGIYWVSAPTPTGWEFSSGARQSRQTGIHIYAFDVGVGTEWRGPAPGRSSDYDFSTLQARFQQVLRADPLARFHLRCHLEIGHDDGWEKEYPQECEVTSEGKRNGQSFASSLWRSQAHDFLRAYIRHCSG